YFSVQLIDYYTFNFDYIGTRTSGNGGGSFLLAGPGWKGETPKGIKKVFRCETELAFPTYRTQLFNPGDIDNVKKVQAGYKVQPLSGFTATRRTRRCIRLITWMRRSRSWTVPTVTPCALRRANCRPSTRSGR